MNDTLYIIGNGFDLHHGLKTSYKDFYINYVNSEADGILWMRNELKMAPQTRQDLYAGWMHVRGAVHTGDNIFDLDEVLAENFIKEPDGKWCIPNQKDEKDLAILRAKTLLKEFNLFVEQASKTKSKIKEAREEALCAGVKQCYINKDFKTIVMDGDKIPENQLTEDRGITSILRHCIIKGIGYDID